MISLLLSLAFADTTVYAPMTNRLETTIGHYFIDKDFHARKKDMLVINWADCEEMLDRECAMVKGYWYLDVVEFEDDESYQINIFLYDDKSRIVSQSIITKDIRLRRFHKNNNQRNKGSRRNYRTYQNRD